MNKDTTQKTEKAPQPETNPKPPLGSTPAPLVPPKMVYINFFSKIDDTIATRFMTACAEIIKVEKADCLYFLFASPGGSVDAGVAIYNFLRSLPVKLVMHNNGAIDSVANVIFHAADERKATPHATFLFHGVGMELPEKAKLNRSQIQELLSQIKALEDKIAKIISERSQLTIPEIQALFLNGETKDTEFATVKGIVQSVSQPLIPADAKLYSLNFT
jgi:ATP-dependent protease ClpP protease subunit